MLVVNRHSFFEDLQENQEEMGEMEGMVRKEPEVISVMSNVSKYLRVNKYQSTIRKIFKNANSEE
jgi:hypothetical protein